MYYGPEGMYRLWHCIGNFGGSVKRKCNYALLCIHPWLMFNHLLVTLLLWNLHPQVLRLPSLRCVHIPLLLHGTIQATPGVNIPAVPLTCSSWHGTNRHVTSRCCYMYVQLCMLEISPDLDVTRRRTGSVTSHTMTLQFQNWVNLVDIPNVRLCGGSPTYIYIVIVRSEPTPAALKKPACHM